MTILDGKKTAEQIQLEVRQEVDKITARGGKAPHLAAVLVGNNGASLTYVNNKIKACHNVGFRSTLVKLPEYITEKELLAEIDKLNHNTEIDGYIVQLPLPKHINEEHVLINVSPSKDVDGFHPENFGKMALGMKGFIPATPFGIVELIKRYNIPTRGKHVVVIGRSHIVGRPISILMSSKGEAGDATVTVLNSYTPQVEHYTKQADIIITALGHPKYLKADMVRQGCSVIDVGITRVNNAHSAKGYSISGDVDYDEVSKKVGYITPVPGGVGPMTIAMLLKNTLMARLIHEKS